MTQKEKVYLWAAAAAATDFVLERMKAHVTGVARHVLAPSNGSLVIGVATDERVDGQLAVVLIGRASSKSQVATGLSRFKVTPLLVPDPIPFTEVLKGLSRDVRSRVKAGLPSDGNTVPLRATDAKAVIEALRKRADVAAWLDGLKAVPWHEVSGNRRAALEEATDALRDAVEASRVGVPLPEVWKPTPDVHNSDVLAALVDGAHLRDNEDALINADLRRFAEDTRVTDNFAAHAVLLEGYNHSLAVLNVNRMDLEKALGVDLIYWDLEHETATMLQYKRLDKKPPSTEWRFSREQELKDQLELMKTYQLRDEEARKSCNWRMTSPYWFKFVRRDAANEGGKLLLQGMYVPADYLRVAIADESFRQGERGGFHIAYDNTFYITRDAFTELLGKGVIGTTGAQSDDVAELIRLHGQGDRALLLAVKDKKEKWTLSHTSPEVDPLPCIFGKLDDDYDEPVYEDLGGELDELLKSLGAGDEEPDGPGE